MTTSPLAEPAPSTAVATVPDVGRARRGLAIYFVVVVIVSGLFETLILRGGGNIGDHRALIAMLMWTPAFASLVARLALREGVRDVSFRFGGLRGANGIVIALLMPVVVGSVAYGIAWSAGLVGFDPPVVSAWMNGMGPLGRFFTYLVPALSVGTVLGMITATGEELGWRGYMLTRLIDAKVPHPLLVSGIIWSLWHFPLILSGQYAAGPHPLVSAGLFMVDVIGIAYVIGIVRLRSGSVWPAAVLHGAWNSVIQGPFDRSTTGAGATVWVGESGVLVAIASILFAMLILRRGFTVRHYPDEA